MAYRDNVQRLCDTAGIQNPIREEDLSIAKMNFWHAGRIQHTILATDMNRGGRLFLETLVDFQDGGSRDRGRISALHLTKPFKALAEIYFAELWADAGTGKRVLIDAIHSSDILDITWKHNFQYR